MAAVNIPSQSHEQDKCTEEIDLGGGGDCNHHDAGVSPLELLPEEMWLKLFTFLEPDPRDMINLAETCSVFNCWLKEDVPAYRLQEAIPLIVKWLSRVEVLTCRGICSRVIKPIDLIIDNVRRMEGDKILNLFPRLVPPYFRHPPDGYRSFEWEHFGIFHTIWPFCFGGTKLFTSQGTEMFRQYLEEFRMRQAKGRIPGSRKETPIVGKRVAIFAPKRMVLNLNEDNLRSMRLRDLGLEDLLGGEGGERILVHDMLNPEEFNEMMHLEDDPEIDHTQHLIRTLDFLSMYPEHIVYLEVALDTPSKYTENYSLLQKIMGTFQNLRCLYRRHARTDGSNLPSGWKSPRAEEITELDNFIANGNPLPECPFLEKLQISQYYLPGPYFREIVSRYGAYLPSLMVELADDPSFWKPQLLGGRRSRRRMKKKGKDVLQTYSFPAMRGLALWISWRSQPLVMSIDAPKVTFLQLSVEHPFLSAKGISPFTQIVQIIQNFPSMNKFRLAVKGGFESAHVTALDELTFEEYNHTLKGVSMDWDVPFSNVPLRFFARFCRILEELTVESSIKKVRDEFYDEDLVLLRSNRMEQSTLWKVAPHLHWIQLKRESDTSFKWTAKRPMEKDNEEKEETTDNLG